MARDYAALAVGDVISDRRFPLGLDGVAKYAAAVRDESGVFDPADESPTVPPMAVATFALRGVLDDLGNTGGDDSRGAGDGVSWSGRDGRGS